MSTYTDKRSYEQWNIGVEMSENNTEDVFGIERNHPVQKTLPHDICVVFYFFPKNTTPLVDYVQGEWEECKRKVYKEIGDGHASDALMFDSDGVGNFRKRAHIKI